MERPKPQLRGNCSISRREADYGHSTLFTTNAGLENAKQLISAYKQGKIRDMNKELWTAKKIIDSTLHPGTAVYFRTEHSPTNAIRQTPASQSSSHSECHVLSSPISSLQLVCLHQTSDGEEH